MHKGQKEEREREREREREERERERGREKGEARFARKMQAKKRTEKKLQFGALLESTFFQHELLQVT